MYNNHLEGRSKSDIVFYTAFKEDKKNKQSYSGLKSLLFIMMGSLLILNLTSAQIYSNDLFQAILVNAFVSLFGIMLPTAQLSKIYSNPEIFLMLAESSMHVVPYQLTNNVRTVQDCVSSTIFIGIGNLNINDLNEPTKKAYIAATLKALRLQISSKYKGFASLTRFNSVLSMVSLINSIIILSQQPNLDSLNKSFLIIYIVLVGLSQLLIVLVLVLLALIPLILCIFCFYVCCCKVNRGEGVNLPIKNANMQDILNCDGTCSICYQNIGQNQQIYVLPCSNKHVFHKDCLGHWSRVKNTCPICRAEIPMGGDGSANLLNDQ